jgi:hypothetical protein
MYPFMQRGSYYACFRIGNQHRPLGRPRRELSMRLTLWTGYALRTMIYVGAKAGQLSTTRSLRIALMLDADFGAVTCAPAGIT